MTNIKSSMNSITFLNSNDEIEQPRFLTGWTPVVKLFVMKNQAVKALWAMFTICMVIALVSSMTVVVHKYLTYVTVVRLDQRAPKDGVPPPAVTVCLMEHQIKYVRKEFFSSSKKRDILQGIKRSCQGQNKITWDSSLDAVSEFYKHTTHFKVNLRTEPPGCYFLSVIEQVPNPPDMMCTTFQLTQSVLKNATFWKIFHIEVRLIEPNRTLLNRPLIIAHEINSFPFDNYGRYLYEYMNPGSILNIFYSKSITKRLNTGRNPCSSKPINLFGLSFDYDQMACQWYTICQIYHQQCGSLCPFELLHLQFEQKYNQTKLLNQMVNKNFNKKCQFDYSTTLVNNSVCPLSCHTVTYKKLNEVYDNLIDHSIIQLELIQAEGLTEMTEEALYSLAKLFSEIGGLSSFCFGFSCILFFELFELTFWLKCTYRSKFINYINQIYGQQIEIIEKSLINDTNNNDNTDFIQNNHNFENNQEIKSTKEIYKDKLKNLKGSCICTTTSTNTNNNTNYIMNTNISHMRKYSTENRFKLNSYKLHEVDGARLSEYPKDQNSPLLSLKNKNIINLFKNSQNNRFNMKQFKQMPMMIGVLVNQNLFDNIPMEIHFSSHK